MIVCLIFVIASNGFCFPNEQIDDFLCLAFRKKLYYFCCLAGYMVLLKTIHRNANNKRQRKKSAKQITKQCQIYANTCSVCGFQPYTNCFDFSFALICQPWRISVIWFHCFSLQFRTSISCNHLVSVYRAILDGTCTHYIELSFTNTN
jgi:hypothetical protein